MREKVMEIWPEIDWIQDEKLREAVLKTWVLAFERSPLEPEDLLEIPFTLVVPDCPATFMEHKRCVVHISKRSAEAMTEFLGGSLPIDMDTVIAGAILADVGKLLEYEKKVENRFRATGAKPFAIHLPASPWPWNAEFRTRFATLSRLMQQRAIWSSERQKRTLSTMPTS